MTNQSFGDEVDRLVHLRKLQGLGNEHSQKGRLQAHGWHGRVVEGWGWLGGWLRDERGMVKSQAFLLGKNEEIPWGGYLGVNNSC